MYICQIFLVADIRWSEGNLIISSQKTLIFIIHSWAYVVQAANSGKLLILALSNESISRSQFTFNAKRVNDLKYLSGSYFYYSLVSWTQFSITRLSWLPRQQVRFFSKCLNVSRYFGSFHAHKNGFNPEFTYIKITNNALKSNSNHKLRWHGRQNNAINWDMNHGKKQRRNAQMTIAVPFQTFLSLQNHLTIGCWLVR